MSYSMKRAPINRGTRIKTNALPNQIGGPCYDQSNDSECDSREREHAAAGQQGDRGYNQSDLEEDFTEVVSVGATAFVLRFLLQLSRFGVYVLLLVAILVCLSLILLVQLGCLLRIVRRHNRCEICEKLIGVPANVLGLVVSPLIAQLILQDHFFGMRAVPE